MQSGVRAVGEARELPSLEALMSAVLQPVRDQLLTELAERGHVELRPCHGIVLSHLADSAKRLTELSVLCQQPKQYVGRLVDELETLGYVTRQPDPTDRRGKLIAVTERGRTHQRDTAAILEGIESSFARQLGVEPYAQLRAQLARLVLCQRA